MTIIRPTLNYGREPWSILLAKQGGRLVIERGEHYCGPIAAERVPGRKSESSARGR